MNGMIGTSELTSEQSKSLAPRIARLNQILCDVLDIMVENTKDSEDIIDRFVESVNIHYDKFIEFTRVKSVEEILNKQSA